MKENSIKNERSSIEEDIIILEQLIIANENCIKNAKNKDNPFVTVWKKQNIAIEHILSDYKRVLKENELLSKDIESWNKYCEEIEEERIEMSNKNCELEFKVEKLQKENEELKNKLLDTLEGQKVIKEETPQYIKENYIPIQKIKDRISERQFELQQEYKDFEDDAILIVLQELLEGEN